MQKIDQKKLNQAPFLTVQGHMNWLSPFRHLCKKKKKKGYIHASAVCINNNSLIVSYCLKKIYSA